MKILINLSFPELFSIIPPENWPYLFRFHCPYDNCNHNFEDFELLN